MSRRSEAVDLLWDLTKAVTGVGSQSQTSQQKNVERLLTEVEFMTSSPSTLSTLAELVLASYEAGRASNSSKESKQ